MINEYEIYNLNFITKEYCKTITCGSDFSLSSWSGTHSWSSGAMVPVDKRIEKSYFNMLKSLPVIDK